MDDDGAAEIARRSRGTPRVANRLLRRVRDFAEVRAKGHITLGVAREALAMLGVDEHGLDEVDRNLMLTIIQKYSGGPVGLNTIAASLSEEEDAIEEIYEPYLMQLGLLDRTQRGRVATPSPTNISESKSPAANRAFSASLIRHAPTHSPY